MIKYLANALIGGDGQIEKRNMSWNMIGSFLYALASMVLTIAVIQIVGEDEGGIFSFAYSTFGQHMFMVAYFGIRPFQITDTRRRFTFGEYLRLRLMTCGAALVAGLFYVTVINRDYAFVKAATVFLMVAYKVIDGFADAYEAEFQRDGRLYLTGKSNAFRTVLSVGVFLGCLNATHNLVGSCLAAVLAQLAGVCLFDFSVIGHLPQVDWEVRSGRVFSATSALWCAPTLPSDPCCWTRPRRRTPLPASRPRRPAAQTWASISTVCRSLPMTAPAAVAA